MPRILGVIAEYNPFHLGHAHHLKTAREACQSDYVVVVMSACFTQRGEAAICQLTPAPAWPLPAVQTPSLSCLPPGPYATLSISPWAASPCCTAWAAMRSPSALNPQTSPCFAALRTLLRHRMTHSAQPSRSIYPADFPIPPPSPPPRRSSSPVQQASFPSPTARWQSATCGL
ncbi:MAG: nucleotidyltransferase family protein [Clostridia bacterium]|nr:nucleotidyltransferase family protein [Clostridia bacterium]